MVKSLQAVVNPRTYLPDSVPLGGSGRESDNYVPISWVLKILEDFKALDCHSCCKHVGYQHRRDPNLFFCSEKLCLQKSIEGFEQLAVPKPEPTVVAKSAQLSHSLNGSSSLRRAVVEPPKSQPEPAEVNDQKEPSQMKRKYSVVRKKTMASDQSESWSSEDNLSRERLMRKPLKGLNLSNDWPGVRSKLHGEETSGKACRPLHDIRAASLWMNPFVKTSSAKPQNDTNNYKENIVEVASRVSSLKMEQKTDGQLKQLLPLPGMNDRNDKKIWRIQDLKLSGKLKDRARVVITFIWSPDLFTIAAVADVPKMDVMQSCIAKYCRTKPCISRIPEKGDIIFAPYRGEFYRANVEAVLAGKQTAQVHFLDYGDHAIVSLSKCRDVCDAIMREHPIYGMRFECSTEIPVPKELPFSKEMTSATEEEVVVEIEWKENWKWHGKIHIDGFGYWNEMLEKRVADFLKIEGLNCELKNQPKVNAVEAIQKEVNQKLKIESILPAVYSDPPKSPTPGTFLHDMQISTNLKHGAIVRVVFMWGYQKLTLTAVDDLPKVEKLQALIQRYGEAASTMKRTPKVKEVVIAPCGDMFARAVVESVTDEAAVVRFMDIGDEKTVKVKLLKEISPEIKEYPLYGIVFNLMDVSEVPPSVHIPEVDVCLESDCQIEVNSKAKDSWTGYLWVARDHTWNEIVLDALKNSSV